MKESHKSFFKIFLFAGLTYAILSAGFDYSEYKKFRELKFLADFFVFGLGMGLFNLYMHKKQNKKTKKPKDSDQII